MILFFYHKEHEGLHKGHGKVMTENELAKIVFEAGMKVHKALGAGLLESAYEECLFYELQKSGVNASSTDNYSVLCVKLCVLCGKKTLRILEKPKSSAKFCINNLEEQKVIL